MVLILYKNNFLLLLLLFVNLIFLGTVIFFFTDIDIERKS